MMTRALICSALLAGSIVGPAAGAEKGPSSKPAQTKPGPVTVAILDYEVSAPGNKDLGSQMADILTARLSIDDSLALVERAKLGKIIAEQKLKLVGLVDQGQAVKVGKLLGAKLVVMGKGFTMDKKLMIVTKVVGVETGRVKGTLRSVELSKPLSEAIMSLAEDIHALVRKDAAQLLPKGSELGDPVAAIANAVKKAYGDKPRPVVAVIVPEEHRTRQVAAPPPVDPAVETEVKKTLLACGYRVVDIGKNDLADWARGMFKGKDKPWPAALKDADLIVVGEAFSQFALRTGELVTCAARAEVNLIERHTGRIVLADRATDRAVDLAEHIAGKTALQKAGRRLGLAVCRKLVTYKAPAGKGGAAPPAKKGGT
jgi:hypothetical protein